MVLGIEILETDCVVHSAALTHMVSCTRMITCPNSWIALGIEVIQTVQVVPSTPPGTCEQFHKNAGMDRLLGGIENLGPVDCPHCPQHNPDTCGQVHKDRFQARVQSYTIFS